MWSRPTGGCRSTSTAPPATPMARPPPTPCWRKSWPTPPPSPVPRHHRMVIAPGIAVTATIPHLPARRGCQRASAGKRRAAGTSKVNPSFHNGSEPKILQGSPVSRWECSADSSAPLVGTAIYFLTLKFTGLQTKWLAIGVGASPAGLLAQLFGKGKGQLPAGRHYSGAGFGRNHRRAIPRWRWVGGRIPSRERGQTGGGGL